MQLLLVCRAQDGDAMADSQRTSSQGRPARAGRAAPIRRWAGVQPRRSRESSPFDCASGVREAAVHEPPADWRLDLHGVPAHDAEFAGVWLGSDLTSWGCSRSAVQSRTTPGRGMIGIIIVRGPGDLAVCWKNPERRVAAAGGR